MFENLAQYKILDRIGAGGMGEVYRARDTRLGRTVAVKVLAADVADDPERRDRFLREARASAVLSHPNIAALYEIGEDQGQLFLVFEFVPGETLKQVIGGQPLNPRRAIDLAVQMADALADAHATGIVHRDIKPANVIVTPKGSAKILDFGLATWTAGGAEREHAADAATVMATSAGMALGTLAYMSPEQALGEPLDHRTDIFSLGIVLFEMLTGRLPFTGKTATATAMQIVQTPAPAPSALTPSLPLELDEMVAKALAKSADARYESAAGLAADLRSVAAQLDARNDASDVPATTGLVAAPRRSYTVAIGLLVLVVVTGAAAWIARDPLQRFWRGAFGSAPSPVIAVIPLDLAAEDAANKYFADGLTEDLITRLGHTPGLKVIGRSATRELRGRTPRDVARELRAGVILTGSVRRSGETVKVSLELIDPADGTAIWSNQYTRDMKDIFAVQAQVADDVAQALRVTLQPTPSSERARARLVDRRAYDMYLRGRQAAAERRLADAIPLYEQAIAADAGLAEAFAGLAEALHLRTAFEGEGDNPSRLKAAAERAFQLDEDSAPANLAMGLSKDSLREALTSMRRALDLDPSFAEAYHQIGDQIQDFAPELSVAFYQRSLALDPRLAVGHSDLVVSDLLLNRHEDAWREISVASGLGRTLSLYIDERRYDVALAEMRNVPQLRSTAPLWATYILLLQMSGQQADAFKEGAAFLGRFPSCDARALVAGLRLDRGQTGSARQLVEGVLRDAASESASPETMRCAAKAAAAVKDTARLAAILDHIAAREDRLRFWALQINGVTGGMLLRGRMYPFDRVINDPAVVQARERLDAAYAVERDIARTALAGLP